ncbi:MAG: glycoside hydrolase family 1 protein [Chloroflexi bacterium]|nr:glycoside hydrolase family 1 protein [Chloroflexota bacterium]
MNVSAGSPDTLVFPRGFLWGAATSAHQTEGQNRNTDWWQSEQAGLVPHRSGDACDSWDRWPEDVALVQQLGLNAYRMSVEWARIEPQPGVFDQAVLDHYRQILEATRAAGLEPIVTLHHFTNPLWLSAAGGWRRPEVVARFAAYTDEVSRRVGDLVQWWVTINEPMVFGLFGYVSGAWPPHRRNDLLGYLRQTRHTLAAHAAARQVLRSHSLAARASMALHLNPIDPVRVGVNYYFRVLVRWDVLPWRFFGVPEMGPHQKTEYGWEIYPKGLYRVLKRVGRLGKPVFVTENGIADADDDQRARYLVAHLRQAHRALNEGVDLRGYIHWSLLDNFEWSEGFTKRFGLAEVDPATKQRTLRASAQVYRQIALSNSVSVRALQAGSRSTATRSP